MTNELDLTQSLVVGWSKEVKDFPIEELDVINWGDLSYEFDMTTLFRHKPTGTLLLCDDEGCSCPSPYDGKSVGDCTVVTRLQDLYNHVDIANRYGGEYGPSVTDYTGMVNLVSGLLNGK